MIRPDRFEFAVFIMSYGITALLLAQAVRCLSPALLVHHEHLVVRHCAFPNIAPIEIELTCDVSQFLQWLGLEYDQWQHGFDEQHDYYQWVSGVRLAADHITLSADLSLINRAWGRFVASGEDIPRVKTRHQPARRLEMDRFRDWLRALYASIDDQGDTVKPVPQVDLSKVVAGPTTTTFTIVTKTSVSVDPLTGKTTKLS